MEYLLSNSPNGSRGRYSYYYYRKSQTLLVPQRSWGFTFVIIALVPDEFNDDILKIADEAPAALSKAIQCCFMCNLAVEQEDADVTENAEAGATAEEENAS